MARRGRRAYDAVEQRDAEAERHAAGQRFHQAARRGAVEEEFVADTDVVCWDDEGLAVHDESDVANEGFIENGIDQLAVVASAFAPAALALDARFDASGRTGANFSRINRDIRFAKDKTLYKTHMYLKFSVPAPEQRETGQLYLGLSLDTVTAGFRIYSGGKRKDSTLALAAARLVNSNPR